MWFQADFETDASHFDENGKPLFTYVWAWAVTPIDGDINSEIVTGTSFSTFLEWCEENVHSKDVVMFHNLSWDGYFCLYSLMVNYNYTPTQEKDRNMPPASVKTLISGNGVWYKLVVRTSAGKLIQFQDSYKKIPFSEAKIAKDLKLGTQKGSIDYNKYRPEGGELNPIDEQYIKDDVRIMATALYQVCICNDHEKMTIGSDCLNEFKKKFCKDFDERFPVLTQGVDEFIRKSYRGGITYVKGGCHEAFNGCTFDATSLYPSRMHSKSRNIYPYGDPVYFEGEYKTDKEYPLYVAHIVLTAKVKRDHMPFLNLRNVMFGDKQYMEECDRLDLTLTSVDLRLLFEQYNIIDIVFIDGYKFKAKSGMFDGYIDHYFEMKDQASREKNPVLRMLAKLMLNNLYGKFGTRMNKENSVPCGYTDNGIQYMKVTETGRGVYIPVGCFVTAYARLELVHLCQANWKVFDMCDTDSLHMHCAPDEAHIPHKGNGLCEWKLESEWRKARFIRQKTYCEEIISEGGEPVTPYLDFKCAGAPPSTKRLFTWENFKPGLGPAVDERFAHCKNMRKRVPGGFVLVPGPFSIKC